MESKKKALAKKAEKPAAASAEPEKPTMPKKKKSASTAPVAPAPPSSSSDSNDASEAAPITQASPSFFSDKTFASLPLLPETFRAIKEMGFERLTLVQAKCLKPLMRGRDVLARARTGSGKTMAFLLPTVELLARAGFQSSFGTGAVIIAPTRELATQIHTVAMQLLKYHSKLRSVLIVGGNSTEYEEKLLKSNATIVICTPGRLLEHLQMGNIKTENLLIMTFDEADRMLEIGYESQMKKIVKELPQDRQTMLFSATLTPKLDQLSYLSLHSSAVFVDANLKSESAAAASSSSSSDPKQKHQEDSVTAAGLDQYYMVVPSDHRFDVLLKILTRARKGKLIEESVGASCRKIIIFFGCALSAEFHKRLLEKFGNPSVFILHGKQKTMTRKTVYNQFVAASEGILVATDVAARGLDIPACDLIIQYDPPFYTKDYVHRVGRTARAGHKGTAILFLQPEELEYIRVLAASRIPIAKMRRPKLEEGKPTVVRQVILEDEFMHKMAMGAYKAHVGTYKALDGSPNFSYDNLNLKSVIQSFGFVRAPQSDEANKMKEEMDALISEKKKDDDEEEEDGQENEEDSEEEQEEGEEQNFEGEAEEAEDDLEAEDEQDLEEEMEDEVEVVSKKRDRSEIGRAMLEDLLKQEKKAKRKKEEKTKAPKTLDDLFADQD